VDRQRHCGQHSLLLLGVLLLLDADEPVALNLGKPADRASSFSAVSVCSEPVLANRSVLAKQNGVQKAVFAPDATLNWHTVARWVAVELVAIGVVEEDLAIFDKGSVWGID